MNELKVGSKLYECTHLGNLFEYQITKIVEGVIYVAFDANELYIQPDWLNKTVFASREKAIQIRVDEADGVFQESKAQTEKLESFLNKLKGMLEE